MSKKNSNKNQKRCKYEEIMKKKYRSYKKMKKKYGGERRRRAPFNPKNDHTKERQITAPEICKARGLYYDEI